MWTAVPPSVAAKMTGVLAESIGDAGSSRLMVSLVIGLVVLGAGMLILAWWVARTTRYETAALGPLAAMSEPDWLGADDDTKQQLLEEARPKAVESDQEAESDAADPIDKPEVDDGDSDRADEQLDQPTKVGVPVAAAVALDESPVIAANAETGPPTIVVSSRQTTGQPTDGAVDAPAAAGPASSSKKTKSKRRASKQTAKSAASSAAASPNTPEVSKSADRLPAPSSPTEMIPVITPATPPPAPSRPAPPAPAAEQPSAPSVASPQSPAPRVKAPVEQAGSPQPTREGAKPIRPAAQSEAPHTAPTSDRERSAAQRSGVRSRPAAADSGEKVAGAQPRPAVVVVPLEASPRQVPPPPAGRDEAAATTSTPRRAPAAPSPAAASATPSPSEPTSDPTSYDAVSAAAHTRPEATGGQPVSQRPARDTTSADRSRSTRQRPPIPERQPDERPARTAASTRHGDDARPAAREQGPHESAPGPDGDEALAAEQTLWPEASDVIVVGSPPYVKKAPEASELPLGES